MSKVKKSVNVKTLLKKAWDLQSKWVRKKDSIDGIAKCYTCGKQLPWEEMQLGHYEHHGNNSQGYGTNEIDFDLRGLCCQCRYCTHNEHGKVDAKANWTRKIIAQYGDATIDELKYKKQKPFLPSIEEAENLIKKFQELLAEAEKK